MNEQSLVSMHYFCSVVASNIWLWTSQDVQIDQFSKIVSDSSVIGKQLDNPNGYFVCSYSDCKFMPRQRLRVIWLKSERRLCFRNVDPLWCLYRGQANLGLGEPERAKADFEAVLKLEPNNKAAANNVILCNKKIKEQEGREKKIYANMFEKFAQRDREVGTTIETAEVNWSFSIPPRIKVILFKKYVNSTSTNIICVCYGDKKLNAVCICYRMMYEIRLFCTCRQYIF